MQWLKPRGPRATLRSAPMGILANLRKAMPELATLNNAHETEAWSSLMSHSSYCVLATLGCAHEAFRGRGWGFPSLLAVSRASCSATMLSTVLA